MPKNIISPKFTISQDTHAAFMEIGLTGNLSHHAFPFAINHERELEALGLIRVVNKEKRKYELTPKGWTLMHNIEACAEGMLHVIFATLK